MRRRAQIALALGALGLSGCGAFGGDDEVTERVEQPPLVTKQQVERQAEGSPARTFFEWWRALQFDNALIAVKYYSPSVGMTTAKLDKQLQVGTTGLEKRPRLVEVDEQGNRATVLVLLESKTKNPNGRTDRQRTARGFNLVREHGRWLLAENLYLGRIYRVYQGFTAPLREKQKQQDQKAK